MPARGQKVHRSNKGIFLARPATGWLGMISHSEFPQIRACRHYRTRLLKILVCVRVFVRLIFC